MYPYPAIVGMRAAKEALLCLLVNDNLKGLLITGSTGTAKSVLLRSLEGLLESQQVPRILPQNITEDRLTGSVDIEKALTTGTVLVDPGLLAGGSRRFILADDLQCQDETVISCLLNTLETGKLVLERDGISRELPADYVLAAAVNTDDGGLSGHYLDRFDLCVSTEPVDKEDARVDILRNSLAFSRDAENFGRRYLKETEDIRKTIRDARERLSYVLIPDSLLQLIADLCLELGVRGHRGDLALARTAKTLAALDGRDRVVLEDIREAALLTLQHRKNPIPKKDDTASPSRESSKESSPGNADAGDRGALHPQGDSAEETFAVGTVFDVVRYLDETAPVSAVKAVPGKRCRSVSVRGTGRCISYRFPGRYCRDIAVVPTLRAAAVRQQFRERSGTAVSVKKPDLRENVREHKQGKVILFLVDASGSMGVRKRMVAVKGAVFSLLTDAYQKRDLVGLMTFRKTDATLLLSPTKSTALAYRMLKDIPTGGRTPLSKGISEAVKVLMQPLYAAGRQSRVVVLLTDGRMNESMTAENPFLELQTVARAAAGTGIVFVVVDTEEGYPKIGLAKHLASELRGVYLRLEELNSAYLADSMKRILREDLV